MKRLVAIVVGFFFILSAFSQILGQPLKPPKKTPELLTQGKKIYEQNCALCHGPKGDGKGPAGAALKPAPTNFTKPLKEWPITRGETNKVFSVISKGIPNSAMVKWDQLSAEERWALVYTVVEFAFFSKPPVKKTK